jgi:glycosyltransferase involved in cell wall biosynthesis
VRIFSIFFHPTLNFTAVGGAEKRFVQVLKVWTATGVNVTVADPYPELVFRSGADLKVIEVRSPFRYAGKGLFSIYLEWVLWTVRACFLCPSLIKNKDYNLILVPVGTLPGLVVGYFTHMVSGLPLCTIAHHLDFPYVDVPANLASIYRVYRKTRFTRPAAITKAIAFLEILAFLKRSDVCITVSNYTAKVLFRNGIKQRKVGISGNGIDIDLIERFKAEKKLYDCVFVGRVSIEKGVFDLVKVWKQIILNRPESKLLIIGTGPDFSKMNELTKGSNLVSHVMLKGSCSDDELYSSLKASRIFAFPSMFEGWGLAVGEALACGLPVVCYDIPALREIFGACRSVFFVPIGDTAIFAETIEKILQEGDFGKLETISKEYVKNFVWKRVALEDLRIIRNLVSPQRIEE